MNIESKETATNITSPKNFTIFCIIFIFIVGITICSVCMFNNFNFNDVFSGSNVGINIIMISTLSILLSFSTSGLYYMYGIIEDDVPSTLSHYKNNAIYTHYKS